MSLLFLWPKHLPTPLHCCTALYCRYERKAKEEETEARRAEKLVKELERKEREWIAKLRNAQEVQEYAFEELEGALMKPAATANACVLGSTGGNSPSAGGAKRR